MKSGFLEKLIERIGRIGPEEIENYLLRLANEKGFLETIFNALQEGIIVTDSTGRISFMNAASGEMFGFEPDESIGRPITERIRGLEWESMVSAGKTVSRDMEIFYPQNRFLNFYVVPLTLETSGKPSRKKAPKSEDVIGYAMILRDITETRRTTAETIESERLNALTLLAAGVAHEIGNPLNSLHIHLQLLDRKLRKLDGDARAGFCESIDVAKEEVKRLDHIITQFLRALRPAPLDNRLENINGIISESVAFLNPEIQNRDILVEQDLREDLPRLLVDRNQLKQAFYNIIKNSLQAMREGGILRIETGLDDHFVHIRFIDTGGGIPAEAMGRIFDPYFTTKPSGSGLGLMVVRRIVREHGGEIDLINDEGRGLTFTIRLPLRDRRIRMLEG